MDWLARSAEAAPARTALLAPGVRLSYAELEASVRRAGGALAEAGVGPGSRVAVWADRRLETVTALWAVPRLGAAIVPLDPAAPPEATRESIRAAGADPVVGPPSLPDLGVRRHHDLSGREVGPGGEPAGETVHSIVFTSGSTGRPKGVLLTWENLEASAAAAEVRLGNGPEDRWLAVLPLHHVGGLSILWRSARTGGTVLLEPRFEPGRAARLLAAGEATVASLVPTMLHRLLEAHPGPYRGVRGVLLGGAPAGDGLVLRALDAGLPVLPTYGMTETASQVATMPPGEAGARPGAAGTPLPGVELRVVGSSGPFPPGRAGAIEVRGPMVSPGYLGEPARPAGSWFRTGDVGSLDPEGYLTVIGRSDEVIVTGGENVHPGTVEGALRDHPAVREAAVFGEPDPEWGQVVAAAVVLDGRVDPGSLSAFLTGRLAGHEIPRRWRVVAELPKTPLGKLDRARLTGEATTEG